VLRDAAAPYIELKITKLLIAHGADVNAATSGGHTALQVAAYRGNLAVARLLLDAGADINAANGYHGGPLPCAILHRQTKMADFLLKRGADPRRQAEALGLAAKLGRCKRCGSCWRPASTRTPPWQRRCRCTTPATASIAR
jgi:hypothetical protein